VDKRARNEDEQEAKRQRLEKGDDEQLPIYAKKFSDEAIKAEGRRPKKKVAVLIGYAGTGYRGMQLSVSSGVERAIDTCFTALTMLQGARPEDH
jgi:tRNA pseudouridine38-40 synthase